ncbi:MAG: hypothetical protein JO037_05535 [Actinobacteria bacterium]|nr:hypothetical protein [Actinomycetota bacterium]
MTHQTLTRPRPGCGSAGTGLAAAPLPRAPRASIRQRVTGWRARNWRRTVLAWFVLSLLAVVAAAEPATAFPMAQLGSVTLRVIGGLTVAGVALVLIALP